MFVNQIKCDRCGAIQQFDVSDEVGFASLETLNWGSIRAWRGKRRQKDGSTIFNADLDAHLCVECTDEFSQWLGGKGFTK